MDTELLKPSEALSHQSNMIHGLSAQSPLLSTTIQPSSIDDNQVFHGFNVDSIGLLLPKNEICEILNDLSYCQLPNSPEALIGVANVRGDIVPLFDLHKYFSIGTPLKRHHQFIVVGDNEKTIGFSLEKLPIQVTLNTKNKLKEFPPLPYKIRNYVRSCYQKDGLWIDWKIVECMSSNH